MRCPKCHHHHEDTPNCYQRKATDGTSRTISRDESVGGYMQSDSEFADEMMKEINRQPSLKEAHNIRCILHGAYRDIARLGREQRWISVHTKPTTDGFGHSDYIALLDSAGEWYRGFYSCQRGCDDWIELATENDKPVLPFTHWMLLRAAPSVDAQR